MLSVMANIISVVLCSVALTLYYVWNKMRRGHNWPPGPPTVPFLGNINVDLSDRLKEFRKYRKQYGGVFSLVLSNQIVIVVNGLENLKEFFIKNADKTSIRPNNLLFRDILKSKGIAGSSGNLWKEHRTFALSTLREFGFGRRSMEGKVKQEVEVFLQYIREQNSESFDIQKLLLPCVSNVICSIVFGTHYEPTDKGFQKITGLIAENLTNNNFAGFLSFFPFLRYLPGDPFGFNQFTKNRSDIYQHIQNVIDDHRKNPNLPDEAATNYLDAFLKHQLESNDKYSTFSDFQLLRSVNDLFFAGTDTTVNSLSWFALALLYKPEIQQRMRKEIKEVVGDSRLPSLADKENLPYCDAVLHETLRFGNIVPFSLQHGLTEDMQFNGYFIPKESVIIPNLDSVLMDPDLFKDPFEFNPSRFLTDNGCLVGTENVHTFGIGRRICLGEALARMELFLFSTSLIQRFELVRPDGCELPDLTDCKLGTTRSPLPFMVKAVENL